MWSNWERNKLDINKKFRSYAVSIDKKGDVCDVCYYKYPCIEYRKVLENLLEHYVCKDAHEVRDIITDVLEKQKIEIIK